MKIVITKQEVDDLPNNGDLGGYVRFKMRKKEKKVYNIAVIENVKWNSTSTDEDEPDYKVNTDTT